MKTRFTLLIFMCFIGSKSLLAQTNPPIRFYENGKVGYKSADGKTIVAPLYYAGSEFINGFAIVIKDNLRGYINEQGELKIPLMYRDANPFFNGFASVKFGNKYGFINTKGAWVIEPVYEEVYRRIWHW